MPAVKYGNVKDVETDFKHAPIGMFTLKVEEITRRDNDNGAQVEVKFHPEKDANGKKLKDNYSSIFYYAPLNPEENWGGKPTHPMWARRLKELVLSFGLKETGGDLSKISGKSCLARLVEDTDQDGEYRPKIGKLMKLGSVSDEEAEEEDEEAEDEDEDEEEETNGEVDLDEMDRDALKAFIKENELGIRVMKTYSDDDVRAKIQEVIGEEDEEEEDDEEEDDEEGIDLDELDRSQLKALIKEQELEVKVLKSDDDDALRAKIAEAMGGDEEDDDEEEEDDEEEGGDNYDSLTLPELRQECADRELKTEGKKATLIARIRKDDASAPV